MNINPINLIPADELGKGSKIKLAVCDTEHDLYWRMAIEVLEVIKENNAKGEDTIMVVPYGPLGPYFRIAELVNKYRISLKNCVLSRPAVNSSDSLTAFAESALTTLLPRLPFCIF